MIAGYSPSFGGDLRTKPPGTDGRYTVVARWEGTYHEVGYVHRRLGAAGPRGGRPIRWWVVCRVAACTWGLPPFTRRDGAAQALEAHYREAHA